METIDEVNLLALQSGFAKQHVELMNKHVDNFFTTYPVSIMLLGMSFESLIKGLIIEADPSLVSVSKLNKKIETHDLSALATRLASVAGIQLTSVEIGLMHPVLSKMIIWRGRYPIPRDKSNLDGFRHSSEELDDLSALWKKLDALLEAKCPPLNATPAQPR